MEELLSQFEDLKVSAFSKYSQLNGDIHNVTIGPNSAINSNLETQTPDPSEKKKSIKPKKITFPQDSNKSESVYSIPHIIKEYEIERREKVQDRIQKHSKKFEEFSKSCMKQDEWLRNQQAYIQSMREHDAAIVIAMNQPDLNKTQKKDDVVKHQELIKKTMLYEQQLERNKQKKKRLNDLLDVIKNCHTEFSSVYHEIIATIKKCTSYENLKNTLGDSFVLLKQLPESFEEIILSCKGGNVDENLVSRAVALLKEATLFKTKVEEVIREAAEREEEIKTQVQEASEPAPTVTRSQNTDPTNSEQYVSARNLKKYLEIKQFLAQHSELFKDLLADDQMKQFRFDCKKAVNIPTNVISAVSPAHLTDKYVQLHNLLSGKTVTIADKQINAARHPQGVSFCMDLLAKKFVVQGDLMISNHPDAAFCYATVIVSLWNDFPTFGELLLGHLYTECPYLVPFNIPKFPQQSVQEYYVSLGYRYVDGQIEKQDKYLKRMTGFLRLYFAIFIAKPKSGQLDHPYGIRNAWTYLTSLLKLEPQLDVTATALHIFFETVGFEMEVVYGMVFKKVVGIVAEKFLPILKQVDSGGPVSRLEVLLQNYKKNGRFDRPDSILSNNFW